MQVCVLDLEWLILLALMVLVVSVSLSRLVIRVLTCPVNASKAGRLYEVAYQIWLLRHKALIYFGTFSLVLLIVS